MDALELEGTVVLGVGMVGFDVALVELEVVVELGETPPERCLLV